MRRRGHAPKIVMKCSTGSPIRQTSTPSRSTLDRWPSTGTASPIWSAFLCVYLWMSRPAGRRRLGLTSEQIQDFLFYALIGVLVGGRTFFVINDIISKHDLSFYLANPINFIAVWNGGMAFHGGLVGVLVAIWLFVRKHPRPEVHGRRRRGRRDAADRHHARAHRELHQRRAVGRRLPARIVPGAYVSPARPTSRRVLPPPVADLRSILDILTLPILLIVYRFKPEGRRRRRGRGSRSTASRARSPRSGARPISPVWASPAASSTRCR